MNFLGELLDLLWSEFLGALVYVIDYAREHPVVTALAVLGLLRLCGITVQSGQKGVLFFCGRVRKELEPGFHFLLPYVLTARTIPVRSVTLDLPGQRIATADGLVYDVQANIVYRVAEPSVALTQISNLRQGIEVLLAMLVEDLLRGQTRATILNCKTLDAELCSRAEAGLRRWGLTVEQAGFKSIAPTHRTLRLTQLAALGHERERVLQDLVRRGVPLSSALGLLGADHHLVGSATARYRAWHRASRLAPAAVAAPDAAPLLPGEEQVAVPLPQAQEAGLTQDAELAHPATGAPPQVLLRRRKVTLGMVETKVWQVVTPQGSPRRKKSTAGVQPRSWLRLQARLQYGSVSDGLAVQ